MSDKGSINNITLPVYKKLRNECSVITTQSNISELSSSVIENLKCGDIIAKVTGNQRHCYVVTYKEHHQGICLSYFACGYLETVSYDYVDGAWVYNSTDVSVVPTDEHIADIANAQVNGKDISPRNISATGKITGNEIVENMSGYSVVKSSSDANTEVSHIYAGVVKNGKKITFVWFGTITPLNAGYSFVPIRFNIPSSVGEKLYPTSIGGDTNKLLYGQAWFAESYDVGTAGKYWVDKNSDNQIGVAISTSGLTANQSYNIRLEMTFLLSDNLAV